MTRDLAAAEPPVTMRFAEVVVVTCLTVRESAKELFVFVTVSLPFTLMPSRDGPGSVTVFAPLSTILRSVSHFMGPAL